MSASLPPALIRQALDADRAVPAADLAAGFQRLAGRSIGDRIAGWARFFLDRDEAVYVFGDAPGGHVAEGRLVDDSHTDCMLFVFRVVELATSTSPEEAVAQAILRRFPGTPVAQVADPDGSVRYDHPNRLRYGVDMIRSGGYGADVTPEIGPAVSDGGPSRYHSEVLYVPRDRVAMDRLRSGDVVYFVLDEANPAALEARESTGAVIGHLGIVERPPSAGGTDPGAVSLIHAASSDLPGRYTGGRIVRVSLEEYLARVERFKGIMVSRG